jgi:hypothetical protein
MKRLCRSLVLLTALLVGCGVGLPESAAIPASPVVVASPDAPQSTAAQTSAEPESAATAASPDPSQADKTDFTGWVPMGINLEIQRDWSRSQVFVDAIKTARAFAPVATPW